MPDINLETVEQIARNLNNMTFATDDTDQDKLEKVLVAICEDLDNQTKTVANINHIVAKYEKRMSYYVDCSSLEQRTDNAFHHLERAAAEKQGELDSFRAKVIENLLGIRVLCNAILNFNWTHTQKNINIRAISQFVETAIERLQEDDYDLGNRFDPFAPRGSRRALHQELLQAEKDRDKYRDQVATLTAQLAENGNEAKS